jgi:hypothetical protein
MYQNYRHLSKCGTSINRVSMAEVLCTKITDIWSDCARSLNRSEWAVVGSTKVPTSGQMSLGL